MTASASDDQGPFYNSTPWFIAVALRDVAHILELSAITNLYCGTVLSDWFAAHQEELRPYMGRLAPHAPEQWEAIDGIIAPMQRLGERLTYSASSTTMMAAIALESQINEFLVVRFGRDVADAVDRVDFASKFALAYSLLGRTYVGTHVQEAVKEIVAWRNDFAHGKSTARPRGLRQSLPARHPESIPTTYEVTREMTHLIRRYALIVNHLTSLYPPDQGDDDDSEQVEIDRLLTRIEAQPFTEDGQVTFAQGDKSPGSLAEIGTVPKYIERLHEAGIASPIIVDPPYRASPPP